MNPLPTLPPYSRDNGLDESKETGMIFVGVEPKV